jgi:phosphoribosylamine--glycine ligase
MASKGYPESYENGFEIVIPEEIRDTVFVAGAKLDGEKLLSAGGRVLGVTAVKETLKEAIEASYEKVSKIKFDNAHFRRDIGARAMEALK